MLDDRPNCHKVLDQHVWREIEIKMAALQAKRKIIAIFVILELLEDDKIPGKKTKTRNWLAKRKQQGLYITIRELLLEDTQGFKELMRMGPDQD